MHIRQAVIAAFVPVLLVPVELPCSETLCTCRPRPTEAAAVRSDVADRVAAATAVFVGTVQRVGRDSTEREFADLLVTRAWKGVADTVVRLHLQAVAGVRSSCELAMRSDQEWLIFATQRSDGVLHTGYCTLSAPLDSAGSTIAALGPGAPITAPPPPSAHIFNK
jgi:hypothetical protein